MLEQGRAPSDTEVLYADVIVPRHLTKSFTYRVPPSLRQNLRIGHRVLVPFGRSLLQGVVVAVGQAAPTTVGGRFLKEIRSLAQDESNPLPADLLALSREVADRYVTPWGQCLRLVLPPAQRQPPRSLRYKLTEQGTAALHAPPACPDDARTVLEHLRTRTKGLTLATLRKTHGETLMKSLAFLKRRRWIDEVVTVPESGPKKRTGGAAPSVLDRSSVQERERAEPEAFWRSRVQEALDADREMRVLLEAPLAERLGLLSWAIGATRKAGRTVLVLVGEAERADWIAKGLRAWGHEAIAELHAGLSEPVKAERWRAIQQGTMCVVVGTRSAVFAPLSSIGLIWVDGEEDQSLKEPQEPRYHARAVAWMRARAHRAVLVLASDHASLESWHEAEASGALLASKRSAAARAVIDLVDLRGEDPSSMITAPLREAMHAALENRQRVVLYLNRKGYAGALACRDCGQVPRCIACSVALVYHRRAGRLICHYCGYGISVPETCPACLAPRLHPLGGGTEKLEDEVRRFFPDARVGRIDRDLLRTASQVRAAWHRASAGEWDIVIGTQVLFQRHPLPQVGLVGVVHADAGLIVPDFRSAERTYHSLLNAVALARPAALGGRVVLQALLPTHHAIQAVVMDAPSVFVESELVFRRALRYPPAVELVVLHVSGRQERAVEAAAYRWAARLAMLLGNEGVRTPASQGATIVGPAPAPLRRLRGRYRWQMLFKSDRLEPMLDLLRRSLEEIERSRTADMRFDVDVDPVDFA